MTVQVQAAYNSKTIFSPSAPPTILQYKICVVMLIYRACLVLTGAPKPRSEWTSFAINAEEAPPFRLAGRQGMAFCGVCGAPQSGRAALICSETCGWACRLCDAGVLIRPIRCWVLSGPGCLYEWGTQCPKCRELRSAEGLSAPNMP